MNKEFDVIITPNENDRLEYKERLNVNDFAKEIVALANSNGGKIKIGITDDKKPVGAVIKEEDIVNIARNNCVPAIIPIFGEEQLDGKNIPVIEIPRGEHPPYRTNRGRYVIRVGSTVRDVTVDEMIDLIVRGPYKTTIHSRLSFDELQLSITSALRTHGDIGTQNAIQNIHKLVELIQNTSDETTMSKGLIILQFIAKQSVGFNEAVTRCIVRCTSNFIIPFAMSLQNKPSKDTMNKLIDILQETFQTLTIYPKEIDLIRDVLTSLFQLALGCGWANYVDEFKRIYLILDDGTRRYKIDKFCKKTIGMIKDQPEKMYSPQRMAQFFRHV